MTDHPPPAGPTPAGKATPTVGPRPVPAPLPGNGLRAALVAIGTLIMGYALFGVLTAPGSRPLGHALFLAGLIGAHDGVLLPLVIGVGAGVTRFVPPRARTAVRLAAISTLALALAAVPVLHNVLT